MAERIYSEVWHQIADIKLRLVSHARLFKQFYRRKEWYVVQDVFNNTFYRFTPQAYRFLLSLNDEYSVGQQWEDYVAAHPDDAPTQFEVVRMLSQLHVSNLLYISHQANTDDMFARLQDKQNKELKAKLMSFLFVRVPLWNPDRWLADHMAWCKMLTSRMAVFIWLLMAFLAGKSLLDNIDQAVGQGQGLLALNNVVYLYIAMFGLKLLHEMGHAMATKRYGGSVTNMGVMLLLLTPIPYVDASSSWAFRNKYQRVLVGAAGMIVELFIAFIATLVWANTGEGFINAMSFNIMVVASISSVIFNGNPLLKFDAYYMLSDAIEVPNLYQRSRDQWIYWAKRYLYKVKAGAEDPGHSQSERGLLAGFAVLSFSYRILVTVAILLYVAQTWFLLGLIVSCIFGFMWLIKPTFDFIKFLWLDKTLRANRRKAISHSLLVGSLLWGLVFSLPIPTHIATPGMLESSQYSHVYSPFDGELLELLVVDGQRLEAGQAIARFDDSHLQFDLTKVDANLKEIRARIIGAREAGDERLLPLLEQQRYLQQQQQFVQEQLSKATISAPHEGIWVSKVSSAYLGTMLLERADLGTVVSDSAYAFNAVVSQEAAGRISDVLPLQRAQIKLQGASHQTLQATRLDFVPYEQQVLPSASMGWTAGGDIPTKESDDSGLTSREPFFQMTADVIAAPETSLALLHGRLGYMRYQLPSETIADKVSRSFSQLLQQRFLL